jgi:pimeloyl-ACP methyl ester carboxylesterase
MRRHGDAEPIPLASAADWAAAIPGASLVVLPHAGHFPSLEASPVAKEFFKTVSEFLPRS